MENNRNGVSLIVLVITIIVIIILAAAVILTLNNNNPISEANDARYSSDLDNFRYGVDYLPGTQKEVEAIANNFKLFNQKKCKWINLIIVVFRNI